MCNYTWKYKFKVENLLVDQPIKGRNIEFNSSHFPRTEKNKDYTEGELIIKLDSLKYSVQEVVTEGLELIFALNNHVTLPIHIEKLESPPGLMPSIEVRGEAHTTFNIKEAEKIPELWNKYQKLLKNNCQELTYSIRWFMRAIKSENPIDKFIYSWITFNMLYSWLTNAPSDDHRKGIRGLTGKGIPSRTKQNEIILRHNEILKNLSRINLIDSCRIDRAKNLRDSLPTKDSQKILEGAIEAIGFLRHNIFHGSLKDRTGEAERCTWPLIHLNSEIIKHRLNKLY